MACSSECICSVAGYDVLSVPRHYFQIPQTINQRLIPLISDFSPDYIYDMMVTLDVTFPQNFVVVVQHGGICDM